MSMPISFSADISFENFLQEIPSDFHEMAREFKAFARARKIRSPEELLQVVMEYCAMDFSLRTIAGRHSFLSGYISDTAIHERLKASLPWVKAMLRKMHSEHSNGLIDGNFRIVVVDGSTVQAPGAKGISNRLHIMVDLVKLDVLFVEHTDAHTGESLNNYPFREGDLAVADRGYPHPEAIISLSERGVNVVVRYNPNGMILYDDSMNKININSILDEANGNACCTPVRVGHKGKYSEGYLHAIPMPPDQAAQAKRRAKQASKKKGYTLKADTLRFAGWVFIFTTLSSAILNTKSIGMLYRVRWQIELVIKRLKSILSLDRLRAQEGSQLGQMYLYGKLLYAYVVEQCRKKLFPSNDDWLIGVRVKTPWREMVIATEQVKSWIMSAANFDPSRVLEAEKAMRERLRNRKLQVMPEGVQQIIEWCRSKELSGI